MKKIITAIGNKTLNNQLKKIKNLKIVSDDIQYQEGIFDVLELKNNVDFLIIKQSLPGEFLFEDLIDKIIREYPKIKIIILLDKFENELSKTLRQNGVYRVLNYQKISANEIINIINEEEKMEKYNKEIEDEIRELRECIINNNCEKNIEKIERKNNKKYFFKIKKCVIFYSKKLIKKSKIIIEKIKKFSKKIKKKNNKKIVIKINIFLN